MSHADSWSPLSIEELKDLFKGSDKPFWLSGGWAIDSFVGRQTRPHDDLDISIARADQLYFQEILKSWDLQYVDPSRPGVLVPLNHQILEHPAYNIWARRSAQGPWNLQILLCDFEKSKWIYRRNRAIQGPSEEFGWRKNDLRILSPVIQLFYKSRDPRDKDNLDLQNCLTVFDSYQRSRLKELIIEDSGMEHPWLKLV